MQNDLAYTTTWAVMGKKTSAIEQLMGSNPKWIKIEARPGDALWTDSYANLLDAFYE